MDDFAIRQLWVSTWGRNRRSVQQILGTSGRGCAKNVQDVIDFDCLSTTGKIQVAKNLVVECTRAGAVVDSGDIPWFLIHVNNEIGADGKALDDRRVPGIRAAMQVIARTSIPSSNSHVFQNVSPEWVRDILVGGISLAVPYLLSQLEFLFRVHSRYLDRDGLLIRTCAHVKFRRKKTGSRINQIGDAMQLFVFRNRLPVARHLRELEKRASLYGRLNALRHPTAHGARSDASFDAGFVGLLFAIVFYGTRGIAPHS